MSSHFTRRYFLQRAAGASAVAAITCLPSLSARAAAASDKVRCAVIGCGSRGGAHAPVAAREHLVALVDPDARRAGTMLKKVVKDEAASAGVQIFDDYRKLFDKLGKGLDAVFIATPNHHHTLPALIAMKLGISTYVEKPMAYNISECRQLAEYAAKYKVATQMGNQGHSAEGYRSLCEYIWAGAIGNVTEVYHWSDRANGGFGGRPPTLPVPPDLNWDNWIGPAPFRDYHKDLHPHEWHGWHDFGDGSLGNMGCHIMDGAHWALKLEHPTSVEMEVANGGSDERFPVGTRLRWDYPARGDMPPVKIYWFDGIAKGTTQQDAGETSDSVGKKTRYMPPIALELQKKYTRDFGGNGTIYVGDKGYMFTSTYGGGTRIIPEEQHKAFPVPEKTLPRLPAKLGHQGDFLRACRGGEPACSDFGVASKLTEHVLLGALAVKAGVGNKVEWDGPNMKCTNIPALNRHISREYRKGWEV
jgi:predicted dehydrogenase